MRETDVELYERTPLGPARLADKVHPGLAGRAIALARITEDTRTDNVLPGRGPTAIARDDVVQIQVLAVEGAAAVLADVLVALEDVMAGKLDFLFRLAIEKHQQNDPWHTN